MKKILTSLTITMNEEEQERFVELLLSIKGDMSERQLAKKMQISPFALNSWLRGTTPKTENLNKIADYMGISLDVLMSKVRQKPLKGTPIPDTAVGCYELVQHLCDEEKLKLAKKLINDVVN
jgi:transcriptional regulator with XRE-family HTH domain